MLGPTRRQQLFDGAILGDKKKGPIMKAHEHIFTLLRSYLDWRHLPPRMLLHLLYDL